MKQSDIWDKVLDIVKEKLNPISFSTWFNDTYLKDIQDDIAKIVVKMPLTKKILLSTYNDMLSEAFSLIINKDIKIECFLEEELENSLENDVNVIVNNMEDIHNEETEPFESNLNKNLNFDNFVVGDTNKFAKTSALAVAQNPGSQWNPLFIYGKSGLGKTHLMHAIGNYIVEHNPNMKVLYTTSDIFREDYIGISNPNNSIDYANKFKNKYRNIDVLIIDDIQYLVGAEKTLEEFFHTFNELHSKNKQIIISSDRSPEDLKLLEDRLKSRFAWGLPVDIFPPDFELRCRIIKDKIKNFSFADKITEEVIEFIANNCDTDVRNLEGAINRLVAYTAMCVPDVINVEFATEALKDYLNKGNPYIVNDISSIQRAVADYYKITVEVLKGKKRSANIAYPRMLAMYLCRQLTDQSFPRIGLEFGGRDHSTVIHACEKITEDLLNDSDLPNIINEIKGKL